MNELVLYYNLQKGVCMKKIIFTLIAFFSFAAAGFSQTVVFNVKTYKIHKPSCQHAIKCTTNCIKIEKSEAVKRGGAACKVCGG